MRKGRLITEEGKTLENLARHCPNNLLALVITGCDGLSDEAREEIKQDVRTDDRSSTFAPKMRKGLYAVGFPDLDGMKPHMLQVRKEEMEEDERELRRLVRESIGFRDYIPVQDIIAAEQSWCPWPGCAIL